MRCMAVVGNEKSPEFDQDVNTFKLNLLDFSYSPQPVNCLGVWATELTSKNLHRPSMDTYKDVSLYPLFLFCVS